MQATRRTTADYVARYAMDRFLNANLLRHLRLYQFPMYSHIYMEQDEQHQLYFLVEGQVQCSYYHLNGKLAVLALSNPFMVIGDVEILSDDPLYSNVIATRPTTMLGLSREAVQQYGANDPRFLRFLIDQLREKLYKSNSLQTGHVLPVAGRLALYLLSQPLDGDALILPDKDVLASLLGTTTRHLNRVLRDLVNAGAITDDYPRVRVLAYEQLEIHIER